MLSVLELACLAVIGLYLYGWLPFVGSSFCCWVVVVCYSTFVVLALCAIFRHCCVSIYSVVFSRCVLVCIHFFIMPADKRESSRKSQRSSFSTSGPAPRSSRTLPSATVGSGSLTSTSRSEVGSVPAGTVVSLPSVSGSVWQHRDVALTGVVDFDVCLGCVSLCQLLT